MASSGPSSAERAIAAAIYVPIGLGAQLVDDLPAVLNRARQQIVFARFIGKMAVDQGVNELRRRVVPAPETAAGEPRLPADSGMEAGMDNEPPIPDAPVSGPAAATSPGAEELALPDYDQLPASHVVSKLAGLTPSELEAVEAYEAAHRHRRTVLGKIAQLQAT